jgi:hypothetical protein
VALRSGVNEVARWVKLREKVRLRRVKRGRDEEGKGSSPDVRLIGSCSRLDPSDGTWIGRSSMNRTALASS